ncbi:hypothetical protein KFE25_011356 [Diacronema lutheri]|uniref:Peptidylprolyl isomerase n=1 Tax=Diacronema lutheri TaxID=2081491 RepID=A0A8J6C710_DIALT|nr:hypothetical protein KFE25_011356 [Diacronema lutheri]
MAAPPRSARRADYPAGRSALKTLVVAAFSVGLFSLATLMVTMAPAMDSRSRRRLAHGDAATPGARDRHESAARGARADEAARPAAEAEAADLAAAPRCRAQLFAETELGGDVVRWGADHLTDSAAECCAACAREARCNVFVHCSSAVACGELHRQCWLKQLDDAWPEVDALRGKSSRWTSGVAGERPPPAAPRSAADGPPPEVALVTEAGEVRIRLFADAAPLAAAFIRAVAHAAPSCDGCRFYRAEPVPAGWGSRALPDTWSGGRWGPPYALMQGSFMPSRPDEPSLPLPAKPPAEPSQRARPLIRRGMLAWAGGGGGPDGFIALAEHPEWGHGHTVWGEVVAEDMIVVDTLMARPIRTEDWGSIMASVFVTPLPFRLRALRPAARNGEAGTPPAGGLAGD